MPKQEEKQLRILVDKNFEIFLKTRSPIVFGRLEAYKDTALIFGFFELVAHIEERAKELYPN